MTRIAHINYCLESGIKEGKRDDLVGECLIRTLGGWSQFKTQRKQGEKIRGNEREMAINI